MTFYVSTIISILIENLQLILDDAKAKVHLEEAGSKPRLLVFDSGCHDLAYNNSAMFITQFKEALLLIEEIQHTRMFKVWSDTCII